MGYDRISSLNIVYYQVRLNVKFKFASLFLGLSFLFISYRSLIKMDDTENVIDNSEEVKLPIKVTALSSYVDHIGVSPLVGLAPRALFVVSDKKTILRQPYVVHRLWVDLKLGKIKCPRGPASVWD